MKKSKNSPAARACPTKLLPHPYNDAWLMVGCAYCNDLFPLMAARINDPKRQRFCSVSCAGRVKPGRGKAKANSKK